MAGETPDLARLRIDRGAAPRAGRGGWLAFLAILLLIAGWFAWRGLAGGRDPRPEVTLVRVKRVGGASAQGGVSANGYVVARRRAALSTDIQGRLVELHVEEGDSVKAGELIARLDTRQLEASRTRAQADLARAGAAARFARLEYDRSEKLLATGDATPQQRDSAKAEWEQAVARVDSLKAGLDEIGVLIDKSSIYAPFDGVIIQKNAEVGEVVSSISASGPNARGAVATLVDFQSLEVQVELAQTSLRAARVGAPVLIYLDAFPEDAYKGRVRQIWPTADRSKATVELRVEFLERDDRLRPDMGVRAVFLPEEQAEERPGEVLLPSGALVKSENPFVFLFRDGRVVRRTVTLSGEEKDGMLAVESGLEGNEQVVLAPPEGLADGEEVRTKDIGPACDALNN
ncbi:MAG: efflux RND transporter periplasmic adaptor subunit, partial [Planctomycetota bacterium]